MQVSIKEIFMNNINEKEVAKVPTLIKQRIEQHKTQAKANSLLKSNIIVNGSDGLCDDATWELAEQGLHGYNPEDTETFTK
jgi:hypothetical protein